MNNIRVALAGFWGGFIDSQTGKIIPAYQEGYAPRDASFPRIIYQIVRPGYMDSVITNTSIWDRRPPEIGYHGLIDDVLEQAALMIPGSGILLSLGDDGSLWLQRSNPFFDYLNEPSDPTITRGIIHVVVRNYVI